MASTQYCMIYVTNPTHLHATTLAHQLVESGLVACANVQSRILSIYRWEGVVEQAEEWPMLLKTERQHFDAVKDFIIERHDYDCPCIVEIPLGKGSENYYKWITDVTLKPL